MLPANWTQTVQIGNLVRIFLEKEDVLLMDENGKPLAVLVSPERYEERQK